MTDLRLYVSHYMSPAARALLCDRFVGEPVPPGRQQVDRLLAALADPGAVGRALERLDGDQLRGLCVAIDLCAAVEDKVLVGAIAEVVGSRPRAELVVNQLARMGLLFPVLGRGVGLDQPIAEVLARFLPAAEGAGTPSLTPRPRTSNPRFDEAVIAAFFAGNRPKLIRSGRIHQSQVRRLDKLASESMPRLFESIPHVQVRLRHLNILVGGEQLRLLSSRAREHAALSWAAWCERLMWAATMAQHQDWFRRRATMLLDGVGADWLRESTLRRVARRARQGRHWLGGDDPDVAVTRLAQALELDEAVDERGALHYRLPQGSATVGSTATRPRLVVQPSFEVLAPPETPPSVVMELGRFAELVRCEVFATFRLTEAALLAAVDEGGRVEELLELLAQNAAHGVPQNVEVTLRGWVVDRATASLTFGLALVLQPPGAVERVVRELAAQGIRGSTIAPGVLMVPASEERVVRTVLKRLKVGIAEAPPEGDDDDEATDEDWWDPAERSPEPGSAKGAAAPIDPAPLRRALEARLAQQPVVTTPTVEPAAPADPDGMAHAVRAMLGLAVQRRLVLGVEWRDRSTGDISTTRLLVERLHRRGDVEYVEGTDVDSDEGRAIRVDDVVSVRPPRTRKPGRFR